MLIDFPVLIAFDVKGGSHSYELGRAAALRTITLRIDTDDTEKPLQYTGHYPPRDNDASQWSTDTDGIFAGLMPYGAEKKIGERAKKYPTDYCADPQEAAVLEEEIEQHRAANGQFGVGA